MALQADTIATSIAALSVSGVTLKDLDEIPEEVSARDCPIVYPRPDGFMSGLAVARRSTGVGSAAEKDITYQLNYAYLHSAVGEGRGLFDVYQDMVQKFLAVLDALLADDALNGAIDIEPQGITQFGLMVDPSGNYFHGANVVLNVLEFL